MVRMTLAEPFHPLNWEAVVPRLRRVESGLAVQEHLLRTSPEFEAERPSAQFRQAKAKMFTRFICVGNLYGFTLSPTERESRLLNFGTAVFYLQKAIAIGPETGEESQKTAGYAHFCLAVISGLLGVELLAGDAAVQAEGRTLITEAIQHVQQAEVQGHRPGEQYHLKAYLLFYLDRLNEAADSWREAALRWRPASPKLYFNYACVLSKLQRYSDALTQLELATAIFDAQGATGPEPDFNPRTQARDAVEGSEFEPFWRVPPEPAAAAARAGSGGSFQQITA